MSFFRVNSHSMSGNDELVDLASVPDSCPLCHKNIHPKFAYASRNEPVVQAIFQCTSQECQNLFIGTYFRQPKSNLGTKTYDLFQTAPVVPQKVNFPEQISSISPMFVEIYNQAIAAESIQLNQIVGIGLRKSLEFLIKDYSVSEHPDKTEEISKITLSQCIENYVSEARIKECARRATWLGNDETHYIRKWESKDVEDLKLLVRLTVNWIESSLLTKHYLSEMSGGKA